MPGESSVLVRLRLLGAQRFAAESRMAGRSLAQTGVMAEGAAAKMRGVGASSLVAMRGVGRFAKGAGLALGVIAVASGKMAMDFQQAMLMIHTQAGASMGEVHKLSAAVLDLAKKASQSPQELANALYRLEGAGLRGAKAMTALKAASDLAAVGNADVEDTAKTLSQVWFSGIKGAGNLRKVVAELNATVGAGDMRLQQLVDALGTGIMPVAKNAGLRMRDITGALAVFGDETNNVSGWTAQLATALHYLYAPTAKAEGALQSIGLSGSKLGGDFRKKNGLLTALTDLRDHLDKLPGGFRGLKASQTLAEILPGGRGRVMNVMLGQLDRYQDKLKQIGGTTGRFGEAVAKTQQTAAFRVHAAWSTIQVAMIKLGQHILPLAARGFELLASGIDSLSGKMEALARSPAATAIKGFAKTLFGGQPKPPSPRKASPRATALVHHASGQPSAAVQAPLTGAQKAGLAVRKALAPVVAWVKATLPKIGDALLDAGKKLVDAFKPAIPFVKNVLLPILKGIAEGVIGGVVIAFRILVPIIKVVASVLGWIGSKLAPLKGFFVGVGKVIGLVFGGAILKVISLLPKVGVVFKVLLIPLRLLGGAFRFVGGIIGKLGGVIGRAWTWFRRWVGFLGGLPGKVGRIAVNIVGGIVNVLEKLPGQLLGLGKKAGHWLLNGLSGIAGTVFRGAVNLGKKIIEGIINALKAAPNAVKDAVMSIIPAPLRGPLGDILGLSQGGIADVIDQARKQGAKIPKKAVGGRMDRPLAWVGERGPELLEAPVGSRVHSADDSRRIARRAGASMEGGGSIELTANLHLSGKQIHSEVFRIDRLQAEFA